MLTKNTIKYIKSLQQKKIRDELGLFVAEGIRLVDELINSDFEILEIYHTAEYTKKTTAIKPIQISADEMERISGLVTPSPVLAIAKKPNYIMDFSCQNELVLALDTIQDPGNMGTIIRLADWFGINNIVCSYGCADAFAPKTVQASMGAIVHVRVHYVNLHEWIKIQKGCPVYGTFMNGSNLYLTQKESIGIIVMGNEGNGISPLVEELVTHRIHIPSFAKGRIKVESLNVAMATAIILSEFRGHSV